MRLQVGRLVCLVVGHKRSRKRVRRAVDGLRSRCIYCGAPMVRAGTGEWNPLITEAVGRAAEQPAE